MSVIDRDRSNEKKIPGVAKRAKGPAPTSSAHRATKKKSLKSKNAAGTALAASTPPPLAADLRKRLQLKQSLFARLIPVTVRSLATLESGEPPSEAVARRLIELKRLTSALSEVIKKDSLGSWLQTPNQAFDGLKPLEVIHRGESDRLWTMIYFLRSGTPA